MEDTALFSELVSRMSSDSRISVDDDRTAIDIFTWEEDEFQPPVRLHVSPALLGLHLRRMQQAGREVHPNTVPLIGALQLFLVHVTETLFTRPTGHDDLVIVGEDGPLLAVDSRHVHGGGPGALD